MQIEVTVGLNFMLSFFYNKLPRRRVNLFGEELEKLLKLKYQSHWHIDKPYKDSGYRCIKITQDLIDLEVIKAARECGLDIGELVKYLPSSHFILFIDPGEISVRLAQNGPIKILYEDDTRIKLRLNKQLKTNLNYRKHHHHAYSNEQQHILLNDDNENDLNIINIEECNCEYDCDINYENICNNLNQDVFQQIKPEIPIIESFKPLLVKSPSSNSIGSNIIPKTTFRQSLSSNLIAPKKQFAQQQQHQYQLHHQLKSTSSQMDALSSSMSSLSMLQNQWSTPTPTPQPQSQPLPPPGLTINTELASPSNPLTPLISPQFKATTTNTQALFTTASFAQTKFGSTKTKNTNRRQQKMLPSEFSAYIKQKAHLQALEKTKLQFTQSTPMTQQQHQNSVNFSSYERSFSTPHNEFKNNFYELFDPQQQQALNANHYISTTSNLSSSGSSSDSSSFLSDSISPPSPLINHHQIHHTPTTSHQTRNNLLTNQNSLVAGLANIANNTTQFSYQNDFTYDNFANLNFMPQYQHQQQQQQIQRPNVNLFGTNDDFLFNTNHSYQHEHQEQQLQQQQQQQILSSSSASVTSSSAGELSSSAATSPNSTTVTQSTSFQNGNNNKLLMAN